jgi:hypothetical protein
VFHFPQVKVNANSDTFTAFSVKDHDAIVSLALTPQGHLQGGWFSKLFGYVGELTLSKDLTSDSLLAITKDMSKDAVIAGLYGNYSWRDQASVDHYMEMRPRRGAFRTVNFHLFDPYRQLDVFGLRYWVTAGLNPYPTAGKAQRVVAETFTVGSYDFFVNFAAFYSSVAIRSAVVLESEMRTRTLNTARNTRGDFPSKVQHWDRR